MPQFSHLDDRGRVRMVDVTAKQATVRTATAQGMVTMGRETLAMILDRGVKKGNVLETARIAGIMGAKQAGYLIPMCHPLNLTHVGIDFHPDPAAGTIRIEASATVVAPTGVEMEALAAVSVAALTIYDMCKAVDRGMRIEAIRLVKKSGGKSGTIELE